MNENFLLEIRDFVGGNVVFSSRNGGASLEPYNSLNIAKHVGDDQNTAQKNREVLRESIATEKEIPEVRQWIFMNQVHENIIFDADKQNYNYEVPPIADAIVTSRKNLPLVTMTADCGPLVISNNHALAVIHASWKTVRAGIIESSIKHLREKTDQPLSALLGPCIYPDNFEFGQDLLDQLADEMGEKVRGKTKEGDPAFDLPGSIRAKCLEQGVEFDEVGFDTFDSPNLFSFRRDEITGRQATIAWLTDD